MMIRLLLTFTLIILFLNPLLATTWYVSVDGSPKGKGNFREPFTLQYALRAEAKIDAGDTIFLKGGRYFGNFNATISGEKDARVVISSSPGEWAIIDGNITAPSGNDGIIKVDGDYLVFKNLEITHSAPDRVSSLKGSNPKDIQTTTGLNVYGKNNKFINLIIHDIPGNSIALWKTADNAELYGCLLFYPGWEGPDRAHGYNIYTQNGSPEFEPHEYSAGNIVRYQDGYYKAKKHHGDEIRKWSSSKRYKEGARVAYNGKLYVSNISFKKPGIKPDQSADWEHVDATSVDSHLPTDDRYWEYMGTEDPTGYKNISNNFIFSGHRTGISSYTEKGTIKNYVFDGNVIFDNGQLSKRGRSWNLLVGGLNPADNIFIKNNTFYHLDGVRSQPVELGYKNDNGSAVLENNHFINNGLFISKWDQITLRNNVISGNHLIHIKTRNENSIPNYKIENNRLHSSNLKGIRIEGIQNQQGNISILKQAGLKTNDRIETAATTKNHVSIIPNKYEAGRIHITIHNLQKKEQIEISLKEYVPVGKRYKIVDVQNYFGEPILQDIYDGKPISLPMNLTKVTKPLGNVSVQPVHTGKELGTFILTIEN